MNERIFQLKRNLAFHQMLRLVEWSGYLGKIVTTLSYKSKGTPRRYWDCCNDDLHFMSSRSLSASYHQKDYCNEMKINLEMWTFFSESL